MGVFGIRARVFHSQRFVRYLSHGSKWQASPSGDMRRHEIEQIGRMLHVGWLKNLLLLGCYPGVEKTLRFIGHEMAVRLEFLTQDQQAIDFANRYWAMDEEGRYRERVVDLLPFRSITKPSAVAKYVREICKAYDENETCPLCDGLLLTSARADAKKTPRQSYQPCGDCQERRRKEQEAKDAMERAELEMFLAPHIENIQSTRVSYRNFTDDAVIILQAISALIGPRLIQGTFCLNDCMELTPLGTGDFVDRLHMRGILEDDPTAAVHGSYFLKDGELWINKATACYFLPPDSDMGRDPRAINEVLDWKFSDGDALVNLWLDYAVTDVMRYMHYQCSIHNQNLDREDIQKVENMVRHGLRTYSVAQMWFIMWKVTRDAAALASRSYYSKETATATIPTKIRKQLEAADQGSALRNDWSRPEPHIAGALGMVFSSQFGVDELSKGEEVLRMFSDIGCQILGEAKHEKLALHFMEDALERRDSLVALNAFAELVRTGLSTGDAIVATIKENPKLFREEPFASF